MNKLYTEIDDIRETFNNITFSNYQKSKVRKELIDCIYKNKIENILYWCGELICSGHFIDLWDIIIIYYVKYIYTANPKLTLYLSMRYNNFKSILNNGYNDNILRLRNNKKIRNIFSEILLILSLSIKNQTLEVYQLDKREEFNLVNLSNRFKAPNVEYKDIIYRKEDPKELVIPINEIIYSIEIEDLLNVFHWFEWILEYEVKMNNKKIKCECESRVYAPDNYKKDIIWIIWDIIFYYKNSRNLSIYKNLDSNTITTQINIKTEIINSLFNLFTIRYNAPIKRRRKLIIYLAFKFIFLHIDLNKKIIPEQVKNKIEGLLENNDIVYQQIKQNEVSSKTGYLFSGIDKQRNLEKTIEKLEKLENFENLEIE